MHLHNTIVTITVKLPAVEVDRDRGLEANRESLIYTALESAYYDWQDTEVPIEHKPTVKITDCPDYPALVTDIL